MQFFDLHCDTLYKSVTDNSDLNNNSYHISIKKALMLDRYYQLMAVWIPDSIRGSAAIDLFNCALKVFKENRLNTDTHKMFLTVENASMLAGSIKNLKLLTENDVKTVTLTWNDDNEIGSGAYSDSKFGLTDFGKSVVKELERNSIIADVSHASDRLFYDVANIAEKPFIATHSNSRTVTDCVRNLTDEQFSVIKNSGGIVGLNFYCGFLNDNPDNASIDDLLRHAYYFLSLDGEDTLAIGSDFDGADMPKDILGLESINEIYDNFVKEFGKTAANKIFFENARNFFSNFDNNSTL